MDRDDFNSIAISNLMMASSNADLLPTVLEEQLQHVLVLHHLPLLSIHYYNTYTRITQ